MISVSIKDGISPQMTEWLKSHPSFIRSLTKSLGWFAQKEVKKLSRDGRITSKWQKRSPLKIRKKLDSQGKAPSQWLGRLRQAIGYQYDASQMASLIGWTSPTAAMEGRTHEFGGSHMVTPRLRVQFAKRGVPLKASTKFIHVPERPLFEPAMVIMNDSLSSFMKQRVGEYMKNGGFKKLSGAGRKYEVFG